MTGTRNPSVGEQNSIGVSEASKFLIAVVPPNSLNRLILSVLYRTPCNTAALPCWQRSPSSRFFQLSGKPPDPNVPVLYPTLLGNSHGKCRQTGIAAFWEWEYD